MCGVVCDKQMAPFAAANEGTTQWRKHERIKKHSHAAIVKHGYLVKQVSRRIHESQAVPDQALIETMWVETLHGAGICKC